MHRSEERGAGGERLLCKGGGSACDPSLSADPEPRVAVVRAGRAGLASRERMSSVIPEHPSDQRCLTL